MILSSQVQTTHSFRVVPTAAAALAHGIVLLTLLRGSRVAIAPMRLPGTAQGKQISLTYLPGGTSPRATLATTARLSSAPKATPVLKPLPEKATNTTLSTNTSFAAPTQPDATVGNDALGTGNLNIALATSFPAPKPDLSSLPPGTSGDVVLDIVIDASGRVSSITMSRGLGHGIDETVIATVKDWSFHPATRDGQPVPSEQELHFHYEKA